MMSELASSIALFAGLALIGAAPAFLLAERIVSEPHRQGLLAAGLAPAVGLALATILAFPLYRYGAPVSVWGTPVALGLLIAGVAILWRRRGRVMEAMRETPPQEAILFAALAALTWAILAAIPAVEGISRVVFINNPSDALTYVTLGESARVVPWEVLWAGRAPDTSDAAARVISISPTALYSARFLNHWMRLATMIDLAWYAHLTGVGIERLLYAFALAMALVTTAIAYALMRLLGTGRAWSAVVAATMSLGFWAFMIRDHDAYSQTHGIPLLLLGLLLLISAWRNPDRAVLLRLAAGCALAAVVCAYTEFTVVIVAIMIAEAAHAWLHEPRFGSFLREWAWVFLGAVGVLVITAQASYLGKYLVRQVAFVANATGPIGSPVYERDALVHPVEVLAGVHWLAECFTWGGVGPDLANRVATVFAMGEIVAILAAIAVILLWSGERGLVFAALSTVIAAAVGAYAAFAKHDFYSSFKILSTSYPFTAILLGAPWIVFAPPNSAAAARLASQFLAGTLRTVLVVHLAFSAWYLVREAKVGPPPYATRWKGDDDYDFSSIVSKLREVRPQGLLVQIPAEPRWSYSAFAMLALKEFHPYFQSGYLYDNNARRLFHPKMERIGGSDYAVVARSDDYIGAGHIGVPIFETPAIVLYRITGGTAADFAYRPGPVGGPR